MITVKKGILEETGLLLRPLLKGKKALVVSDDNVAPLYSDRLRASLEQAGYDTFLYVFPHGEENKNLETVGKILEFAGENNLSRTDFMVSLGGGICGDITGFAASVYQRGIDFIQVPTTLLAAVDAASGGKTGVNLASGKNQAGTFHLPKAVFFDPDTLKTLSQSCVNDGKAEIIKHAVLAGGELFELVKNSDIMENIEHVTELNVSIKDSYVSRDLYDRGARQLLNFGHTIGHAIEKCSNYTVSHGQAVAMGMIAETKAFIKLYNENCEILSIIKSILLKNSIKTDIEFSADELYQAALHDKKTAGSHINIIAPQGVGRCTLVALPVSRLREYIEAGL